MSAPHIRAALEAACATDCFWQEGSGAADDDIRRDRAAAIAAFLRNYAGMWQSGQGGYLLPDDAHDLAAAVEQEAARDG